MSFGNKLKQLRAEHNLTQLQMSERLSMEQSNYSRYETDKTIPTADIILRVTEVFHVTLDWLIQPESSTNNVNFESGSSNHGTAVMNNHGEQNTYSIPKDVLDKFIHQQNALEALLQKLIDKL